MASSLNMSASWTEPGSTGEIESSLPSEIYRSIQDSLSADASSSSEAPRQHRDEETPAMLPGEGASPPGKGRRKAPKKKGCHEEPPPSPKRTRETKPEAPPANQDPSSFGQQQQQHHQAYAQMQTGLPMPPAPYVTFFGHPKDSYQAPQGQHYLPAPQHQHGHPVPAIFPPLVRQPPPPPQHQPPPAYPLLPGTCVRCGTMNSSPSAMNWARVRAQAEMDDAQTEKSLGRLVAGLIRKRH